MLKQQPPQLIFWWCILVFSMGLFLLPSCTSLLSFDGFQGELTILSFENTAEIKTQETMVDAASSDHPRSSFETASPDVATSDHTNADHRGDPWDRERNAGSDSDRVSELGLEFSWPDTMQEPPSQEPPNPDKMVKERSLGDRSRFGDGGSSGVGTACRVNKVAGVCRHIRDCTGNQRSVPGFCPGPSGVQCCIPKASSGSNYCAVKIPASCQPVSSFATTCNCSVKPPTPLHAGKREKAGQNKCPNGMIRVDKFCIDQYEAALVEVLPSGQIQAWSPFLNPGNRNIKAVSIAGVIPQGYISGVQAAKACRAAGKRLCTDTEWLRACQGSTKNTFPYGKTKQKGWCNEDRTTHPAVEYFGHSRACVFSYISHPCINQLPNSLAKTGSYSRCVTTEGVYDMMGNLHEWTAAPSGIFRGGYYVDTYRNGPGCLYRTTAHTTRHWDYSTGFRCCAD